MNAIAQLRAEIREIRAEVHASRLAPIPTDTGDPRGDDTVVEVYVLGGFTVAVDRHLVEWQGRRASRNLFQLLLQRHPQPINREVLMEALWPGAEPSSSRNRLNVAVHDLRKQFRAAGVEDEFIQHDGGAYRLNRNVDLRIDEAEFVRGVDVLLNGRQELEPQALDDLTAVVGLYQGEYLGTEPHEEWAMARRRYLRRLYISAQDVIARARLEAEDFEACIDACRMITDIDEAHEVAHRRMMMALARAGRTSEALHQFDLCAASLATQLGVEPSEQTLQLVNDIRNGRHA